MERITIAPGITITMGGGGGGGGNADGGECVGYISGGGGGGNGTTLGVPYFPVHSTPTVLKCEYCGRRHNSGQLQCEGCGHGLPERAVYRKPCFCHWCKGR